jgi:heptaprenyl diphosphate synthase
MAISQAAIDDLARKGAERGVDLRPGMGLVEERLRKTVAAELPFVDEASRYLVDAGGKRFRPMLVLLCGMAGGAPADHADLVDAGVIVELVHLSTLYHDDVIDAADVRRGLPAAHVKWSNTVAILTGDFLLARASELSAALGVEVTRIMAATIADLCQGQIREVQGSAEAALHGAQRITPDREHYLKVVGEKTASLIASSCRLGALLSGQGERAIETLTDFGWRLGMTFQLADDVLDIAGEAGESGKLPGTDLREGVLTLPVLLALDAEGPQSELAGLLSEPTDANATAALAILRAHPALELARDAARLEAAKAKRALRDLDVDPDRTAALDGLAWLADYAVDRAG